MLTFQQMNELKTRLLNRQKELNQALENNDHLQLSREFVQETTGELSRYDNHPADTATDLYEREKDIALLEHYEKEQKDIENALQLMEAGEYGKCEVCKKEIAYERLQAIPETTFCIEHSKEQIVFHSRPVEEEVLAPPYGKFDFDETDRTFFDSEDSWQSVAIFGTSETPSDFADPDMPDYNSMIIDEDESVGFVEEIDSFIATDIEGNHIQIYPNAIHEKYEERLDEDESISVNGNLGNPKLDDGE